MLIEFEKFNSTKNYISESSNIVNGTSNPNLTEEEIKKYEIDQSKVETTSGPIPDYWKKAILNSSTFGENKKDESILSFLANITLEYLEDQKSQKVTFFFLENDYFTNSTLGIVYHVDQEGNVSTKESDTIAWKDAKKNPCIKTVKLQKKGKTVGTKEKPCNSFFNIFDINAKDNEDLEIMDSQSEMEFFLSELVPNSFEYYLNIQGSNDDYDDDCCEDGEDDDDLEDHKHKHDDKKKPSKKPHKKSTDSNDKKGHATETPADQSKDPKKDCKNQ